ncbi:hypothetical protein FOZ63_013864 [Perkinsus olseni]|uniref:Uncharacterized protein n=1 Tax=Perkinsus olseni TaxID=32597 RepID=A0A7J6PQV0_PEROL|nr:hypothetical protein FOZ62_030668 [Perkinsus olseni]KAF4737865.1 hypothetical protein FOZ63_013864 [Perkinsus olseni]
MAFPVRPLIAVLRFLLILQSVAVLAGRLSAKLRGPSAGFYDNSEAIEGLGGLTRLRVHIKDVEPKHDDWAFMHVTLGGEDGQEFEMPLVVGIERFSPGKFNFIRPEAEGPTKFASKNCFHVERRTWESLRSNYFYEARQAFGIEPNTWVNPGFRLCFIADSWTLFLGQKRRNTLTHPVKLHLNSNPGSASPSPEVGSYRNSGSISKPDAVLVTISDALGSRERPATLRMWSINKIAAAVTMPVFTLTESYLERSSGSCWHLQTLQTPHERDEMEQSLKDAAGYFGFSATLSGIRLCPRVTSNGVTWLLKLLQPPRVIALKKERSWPSADPNDLLYGKPPLRDQDGSGGVKSLDDGVPSSDSIGWATHGRTEGENNYDPSWDTSMMMRTTMHETTPPFTAPAAGALRLPTVNWQPNIDTGGQPHETNSRMDFQTTTTLNMMTPALGSYFNDHASDKLDIVYLTISNGAQQSLEVSLILYCTTARCSQSTLGNDKPRYFEKMSLDTADGLAFTPPILNLTRIDELCFVIDSNGRGDEEEIVEGFYHAGDAFQISNFMPATTIMCWSQDRAAWDLNLGAKLNSTSTLADLQSVISPHCVAHLVHYDDTVSADSTGETLFGHENREDPRQHEQKLPSATTIDEGPPPAKRAETWRPRP